MDPSEKSIHIVHRLKNTLSLHTVTRTGIQYWWPKGTILVIQNQNSEKEIPFVCRAGKDPAHTRM